MSRGRTRRRLRSAVRDISDIKFVTRLSVADRQGLGTPVFAAPEQLEEGDQATERSDVYSLGRLLYFLLLGRSPGYQVERDPQLENLAEFPAPLVQVVRRATQFDPLRRYANVDEMMAEPCARPWKDPRRWARDLRRLGKSVIVQRLGVLK